MTRYRPVRVLRKYTEVSEVPSNNRTWPPTLTEGETAGIDALLPCLALGAAPEPAPDGVVFVADDNWGHFRQNTSYQVAVTIGEDGVVRIEEEIRYQDESYY